MARLGAAMECEECHTVKPPHEFYRLADGRVTRVDVCRSCRRAKDAPDSPPARANEATDLMRAMLDDLHETVRIDGVDPESEQHAALMRWYRCGETTAQ